jgi:hypothetical protein
VQRGRRRRRERLAAAQLLPLRDHGGRPSASAVLLLLLQLARFSHRCVDSNPHTDAPARLPAAGHNAIATKEQPPRPTTDATTSVNCHKMLKRWPALRKFDYLNDHH